jgi:hypothetical protein
MTHRRIHEIIARRRRSIGDSKGDASKGDSSRRHRSTPFDESPIESPIDAFMKSSPVVDVARDDERPRARARATPRAMPGASSVADVVDARCAEAYASAYEDVTAAAAARVPSAHRARRRDDDADAALVLVRVAKDVVKSTLEGAW